MQSCQAYPDDFFDDLIFMDDCCVYHWDPKTTKQNEQWNHRRKYAGVVVIGMVVINVFWKSSQICEEHAMAVTKMPPVAVGPVKAKQRQGSIMETS